MQKDEYLKYVRKEIIDEIKEYKKSGKRFDKEVIDKPLNSYERSLYHPYLTNKALIELVEYYIKQSFSEFRKTDKYTLESSYNDTLKHKLIHLLIKRLKEVI